MKEKFESFKTVKKANCHLHITGALNAEDIRFLAKVSKIDLSRYEVFEKNYHFHDPLIWGIAKDVTSNPTGLYEAIRIILKREADDNVIYVELTINPTGMLRRGMAISEMIEVIQEGFKYGENLGIRSKVKFGVNRKDGPESVIDVKNTCNAMPSALRFGIDLNGDERLYRTHDFVEPFKQLLAEGIPVSIHAGEYPDLLDSLEEALTIRPTRIAHATALAGNERLFDKMIEANVVVEVCPISNIKTGAVTDTRSHPVTKLIERNIPIIFGSDDPAFFETTLSSELECLENIGIARSKVMELNERALKIMKLT